MKRTTFLAAVIALAGTSVFAAIPVDDAVKALTDQGFGQIEVKTGATTAKIEAIRGTEKVEITIDLRTGSVLKQETGTVADDGSQTSTDDSTDDNGGTSGDDGSSDDNGGSSGGNGSGDDHGGNSGHGGGNGGHGGSDD